MTPSTPKPDRVWLDPKQAADHIGVSVKIIYVACRRHELRHVKLAHSRFGKIRIRLDWLEGWMAKKAIGGDR
jgi:L-alanine-DL-glutamate epimerase-like enolase superfamily enzyme